MPTLPHAPFARATSILALTEEMGITDQIGVQEVTLVRPEGTGGPDPRNPQPEAKVPYLTNGTDHVRGRGAIVACLTDMFPEAGLGRPVGQPQRGAYLGWLCSSSTGRRSDIPWCAPRSGISMLPLPVGRRRRTAVPACSASAFRRSIRSCRSLFQWLPAAMPDDPCVQAWIRRCADRPALRAVVERERLALSAEVMRPPELATGATTASPRALDASTEECPEAAPAPLQQRVSRTIAAKRGW